MASQARQRVPALDGLRGVAILLVLAFHSSLLEGAALPSLFRNFGWAGVDLFFVLSGYLITGVLADTKGGGHYFRNFYARRALRIFPIYYGFLVTLLWILPWWLPSLHEAVGIGDDSIWYWIYLQNFATAADGAWGHSRLLNLFWSLAIEEHFYLIWPAVVLALGRRSLMGLCSGILFFSLALRTALLLSEVSPISIYVLTPARLDALAAGAWVALFVRGTSDLRALRPRAGFALLAAALGVYGLVWWQGGFGFEEPGTITLGLSMLAIGFAAGLFLIVTGNERGAMLRALSTPLLRSFGRYSYAIYVIHQALLMASIWAISRFAENPSPWRAQIFVYASVGISSYALAALSWRFVERPLLGLKRHFPRYQGS